MKSTLERVREDLLEKIDGDLKTTFDTVRREAREEGFQAGFDQAIEEDHAARAEAIQPIFDKLGPERDRHTDWLRCTDEPWFSLAALFRADGQ